MHNHAEYRNPILPGFYPDPSICRVGGDFYLVNSSFAYFPGLPIHHSRDLVHWELIGHVLDRPSQLPLENAGVSRGLFAPTIRYYRGRFYVVCTNISNGGNFIVTADDPAGPWSEPVWLSEAVGIDPSLFFDDGPGGSGAAWLCGARGDTTNEKFWGDNEIWLRELDLESLRLVGPEFVLWKGALRDCAWAEGPHIYRRGDWYYLMISEGGTGVDHALTVARSRSLAGPWIGKPSNPILTHRHLGKRCPIINVGHGDLVDDPTGEWWMVLLASRPYGGCSNLGRETFLVPVEWEDEWPLPCPGSGRIDGPFPAPRLPAFEVAAERTREDFEEAVFAPEWISLRTPAAQFSSLTARPGWLRLRLSASTMRETGAVSYVGRRQRHMSWRARTAMEFAPAADGEAAGLALFQSEDFQYRLELARSDAGNELRVIAAEGGPDRIIARRRYENCFVILEAEAAGQELSFRAGSDPARLETLASKIDGRILSTERAGGFVGTTIGVFATAGGASVEKAAEFDWFEYQGL